MNIPPAAGGAATQLEHGINLLFSQWSALHMAIHNQWGGPNTLQITQHFRHDLLNFLAQSQEEVIVDDVENMLDDFMLSINTELEDGSIEEIADGIVALHVEIYKPCKNEDSEDRYHLLYLRIEF